MKLEGYEHYVGKDKAAGLRRACRMAESPSTLPVPLMVRSSSLISVALDLGGAELAAQGDRREWRRRVVRRFARPAAAHGERGE